MPRRPPRRSAAAPGPRCVRATAFPPVACAAALRPSRTIDGANAPASLMIPTLHDQRLDLVTGLLIHEGATSVLDLGCGAGRLLALLVRQPQLTRITGIDTSASALAVARGELQADAGSCPRLTLVHGSYTDALADVPAHDAVTMVETIEHLDPGRLSSAERTVFQHYRPRIVLITTPNVEYNPLLGLQDGQLRDPDHRFEWPRARFRSWAGGVARRNGYSVRFGAIGDSHPDLGSPSQYAHFTRIET